jgi:hypothetical protein
MKRFTISALFAIAGCRGIHSHPGTPDARPELPPPDGAPAHDGSTDAPVDAPPAMETYPLGMNDISIFMPQLVSPSPDIGTMADLETPDGSHVPLVPQMLFARLVTAHHDLNYDYGDFQVFSIRFDLCDRVSPGPCPEGVNASLRVVFEPLLRSIPDVADVGAHAFYAIPPAELPAVINQLRVIARLSAMPTASTLRPHASGPESRAAIRALLAGHARPERVIRLSVMGHDEANPTPRVVFRSLEVRGSEIVDVSIPGVDAEQQDAVLADADPSYVVTPVADSPRGLALTLDSGAFNAATPVEQRAALDALVATQNPRFHTGATVQCIACHVSTYVAIHRGQTAGIDVFTLPSRFTSERDLGVGHGIAESEPRSLHAFSWVPQAGTFSMVSISQRVANETAMVLDEIDARFPVPGPN